MIGPRLADSVAGVFRMAPATRCIVFRSVVFRVVAVSILVGSVHGCATVGGMPEGNSGLDFISGTFGGVLTVDGTEIEGILDLQQVDGRFEAVFDSGEFGFRAEGQGRLRGTLLDLTLSYEMECRGELRMRGTFLASEGRWEGELVASDCTGDASGVFRFVGGGR